MIIVLCGYMGSGKSLIANLLSRELNFEFRDLDDEIAKVDGRHIPDIFEQKGEIYFRKLEMKVLQDCLGSKEDTVLALGGGTPCYGQNLKLIQANKNVRSVYLKMQLKALTDRLFEERATRPLIAKFDQKEILNDYIRKHLFERQFYYLQSEHTVDCSQATPAAIVKTITEKLAL